MDQRLRHPLEKLCYAAIAAVLGGVVALIGNANDEGSAGQMIEMLGRLLILGGVIYLLVAIWGLLQVLREQGDD